MPGMSEPKNKSRDSPKRAPEDRPSGRAGLDERGNPVWERETQTGEFGSDISTQRLKTLEAPDLSIDETGKFTKANLGIAPTSPGGGFDPYDRHHAEKKP